ncbi:MAG TPA: MBL fold metallo-hydrolase [Longimicrobiales bacterium]|nr:MBL fold metallo-hydrolase [Longimicrobiales bacterium]
MTRPAHHRPDGRYRNPWPMAAGDEALRRKFGRLVREWLLGSHPRDPTAGMLPAVAPKMAGVDGTGPVPDGEVRVTWIGHATTLIQLPGLNLLTDPVWSDRCSPVGFMGPHRFVAPPVSLDALPPIHAVLLSHDHYDHLDRPTVEALQRRFGDDLAWLTPLGYRDWLADLGITRVVERDWWEGELLPGGRYEAMAVPARHWTRRRPGGTNRRLWCGWVIRPAEGGAPGPIVYFAGDSGYCPAFGEIGERLGPFDLSLIPIGAYEPRWFMGAAHMNPEEAVQAYRDAGGTGAFVGIHWGTWRLTFEDPLEPPVRARAAWVEVGLPEEDLHLLRHGETLALP